MNTPTSQRGRVHNKIRNFAQDPTAHYIIEKIGSSEERAEIHEWARINGFLTRSEYVKGEKIVSAVQCVICDVWISVKDRKIAVGEIGRMGEICTYFKAQCPGCGDKTWHMNSDTEHKKAFQYVPSGYMIVMRTVVPGYKKMAPNGGTWKMHSKPSRTPAARSLKTSITPTVVPTKTPEAPPRDARTELYQETSIGVPDSRYFFVSSQFTTLPIPSGFMTEEKFRNALMHAEMASGEIPNGTRRAIEKIRRILDSKIVRTEHNAQKFRTVNIS